QDSPLRWFQAAKPYCNPVEVGRFMATHPPLEGAEGVGLAASCYALAGRIPDARRLLAGLPKPQQGIAATHVFNVSHPVADAGDDVAAASMMSLVLEFTPENFQALYHAGMSEYALDQPEKARAHLEHFLRLYTPDDYFTRTAKRALARIRAGQ